MPLLQGVSADSVHRAVREVFARPEYQWVQSTHRHWLRDLWRGLRDWLARLNADHPVAAKLLFWAALALLIGLLVHIGFTVWRIYRATVAPPAAAAPGLMTAPHTARTLEARADALARQGQYAEAMAYRFLSLLLELDQRKLVSFHPSKTPAEYAGDPRLGSAGQAGFTSLVTRLYRHVFGGEPAGEAEYREFGSDAGALLHVVSR